MDSSLLSACAESKSESEPTPELSSRFHQPSVGVFDGSRGRNSPGTTGVQATCSVGNSSAHLDMIQLVSDLYEGKGSSYEPKDIKRDKAEVENANCPDKASGYGEIPLVDFVDMLDNAGVQAGQNFLDVGSGLGQLVWVAGLLGLDATGVEIVTQRHQQACEAVQQAEEKGIGHDHGSINFVHGSFYDADFSDTDLLFSNSVMFSDEMMSIISEKTRLMKHGSRIISYLALHDVGRDKIREGTWLRHTKSINLKCTFSSGSPFQCYTVVRTAHGGDTLQEVLA